MTCPGRRLIGASSMTIENQSSRFTLPAVNSMDSGYKLHVVVFPWLAFGHVIPFLELSKFIAQKGHKVSFVSTNNIIDRLPQIVTNLPSNIDLVKFSLPHVDHLPAGAGSTMDIKASETRYLMDGFDGLEPELTRFLEKSNPDWVIYDFAPHWLPLIAGKLGISRAYFATINSWTCVFFGPSLEAMIEGSDPRKKAEDFTVTPEWVPFPTALAYRSYETKWPVNLIRTNSGMNGIRRGGLTLSGSDVYFVRDCYEFEPKWLKLLENLHGKPVIPAGLMPPTVHVSTKDVPVIDEWLKSRSKSSILYVALGSEVVLSQQELTELALGLELSGSSFLWALKKPAGSSESDVIELQEGFVERAKTRGLVWTGWAPQLKILSHDSVGGFLTHCGSSSCIEGITFGKPLIMFPVSADQGLNARIYAEKKVGVEMPRNEDGSFTRNYVSDSVRLVMVQDEGYRKRAMELSRIFGDKDLHNRYIDNLVQYMENCKKKGAHS